MREVWVFVFDRKCVLFGCIMVRGLSMTPPLKLNYVSARGMYEHRHLGAKTYSKYTFTNNYDTNLLIQVVWIIIHLSIIIHIREVKGLCSC